MAQVSILPSIYLSARTWPAGLTLCPSGDYMLQYKDVQSSSWFICAGPFTSVSQGGWLDAINWWYKSISNFVVFTFANQIYYRNAESSSGSGSSSEEENKQEEPEDDNDPGEHVKVAKPLEETAA